MREITVFFAFFILLTLPAPIQSIPLCYKSVCIEVNSANLLNAADAILTPMREYLNAKEATTEIPECSENYDFVFKITSIADLVENGWDVSTNTNQKHLYGAVIAVTGLFNKGKTWFVNRLLGFEFDQGNQVSTQGFSFKQYSNDYGNLIVLDTAGRGVPIASMNESYYRDRLVTEELIDVIVEKIADYYCFVVNEITWHDQYHMARLLGKQQHLQKDSSEQRKIVLVVHNLKMVTSTDFEEHYKARIKPMLRGAVEVKVKSNLPKDSPPVMWVSSKEFGQDMRHVFLLREDGKDDNAKKFNDETLKLINWWLFNLLAPAKVNNKMEPFTEVLFRLNSILAKYMKLNDTNQLECDTSSSEGEATTCHQPNFVVQYDNDDGDSLNMVIKEGSWILRPISLNSMIPPLTTGEAEVKYESFYAGGSEDRPEIFVLLVSAPGVTEDDIKGYSVNDNDEKVFILTGPISDFETPIHDKKLNSFNVASNSLRRKQLHLEYALPPRMLYNFQNSIYLKNGVIYVVHYSRDFKQPVST